MVDIIVRAKDEPELTLKCLASISRNTPRDATIAGWWPYRTILVNDGGTSLEEWFGDDERIPGRPEIFIHSATNRGAVSATNLGLAVSLSFRDSDYCLILDNDTEIPSGDLGWLDRMIGELEQGGPRTACVGATSGVVNAPQQILAVPQTYTADWRDEKRHTGGQKDNPAAIWFVSFAVLFRKSVLRELGPWDERYNPGNWEDTDYAMQVRSAGYEIRVARSVYIHHRGHATFGEQLGTLLRENQKKFAEKWGLGRLWDMGIVSDKDVAIAAGRMAGILKEVG